MTYPPVTVVIPCPENGRYNQFAMSLATTLRPEGSSVHMQHSLSIPLGTNTILREMLQGDTEYAWFLADDHVWEPDALLKLLDNQLDVVVPLVVRRRPPFSCVIFKDKRVDENGFEEWQPFAYDEIPDPDLGPFEVQYAGTAGMLIHRRVLEAIPDPWLEYDHPEIIREDVRFCEKIRRGGFDVWCDPRVVLGHLSTFTVVPHFQNGRWGPRFDLGVGPEGAMNSIFVNPERAKDPA